MKDSAEKILSPTVVRNSTLSLPEELCIHNTIPKILRRNAEKFGHRVAIREKDLGIWQSWSWAEVEQIVRRLANGMASLGLKRGDKVAVIGDNRPKLYWSMAATQMLGAVPVPIYQDAVADEMCYVLQHAEIIFAIAEDQEQVDKILSNKKNIPGMRWIFYNDPRGMRDYDDPILLNFDALFDQAASFSEAHPDFLDQQIAVTTGRDLAIILYTSGTTGTPKGVMLSYDNIIFAAYTGCVFDTLTEKEETLAYLPMAWVGDSLFSFAQSYVSGFCVNCPESGATVMNDLREIGPTYFFAPPRIYENLLTTVMIRMEDASWLKRKLFHGFMRIARHWGNLILDGKSVPMHARLLYGLGRFCVYDPLLNTLGFTRVRVAYTAGEAIGPDIFRFFRSLGMNLKQLYGSTEASVYITVQPDAAIRADTVGHAAPGVDLRITADGEVQFRSPGAFMAYFKDDKATSATKSEDGWVHTGDAGLFDDHGHLRIIDRAKDVGHLKDGTLFAPKYIENKLKFFPNIREAVAFGADRDKVCAFINIDLAAMGSWAERNNVSYASYAELAANAHVAAIIGNHVAQVNRDLAADPQLSGSQIHRFLILHKELEADDGELTRTRKIRRSFIGERYQCLVDALYDGEDSGHIDVEITFEDGRKGRIAADLLIYKAETIPVTLQKLAS